MSQDNLLILDIDNISCIKAEVSRTLECAYKLEEQDVKEPLYGSGYEAVAVVDGQSHVLGRYTTTEQITGIFKQLAMVWDANVIFYMPEDGIDDE